MECLRAETCFLVEKNSIGLPSRAVDAKLFPAGFKNSGVYDVAFVIISGESRRDANRTTPRGVDALQAGTMATEPARIMPKDKNAMCLKLAITKYSFRMVSGLLFFGQELVEEEQVGWRRTLTQVNSTFTGPC
jgi:hypothetical protein